MSTLLTCSWRTKLTDLELRIKKKLHSKYNLSTLPLSKCSHMCTSNMWQLEKGLIVISARSIVGRSLWYLGMCVGQAHNQYTKSKDDNTLIDKRPLLWPIKSQHRASDEFLYASNEKLFSIEACQKVRFGCSEEARTHDLLSDYQCANIF